MDGKKPIVIVVIVVVAIVGLYFLISPYQNCVRNQTALKAEGKHPANIQWCIKYTSW